MNAAERSAAKRPGDLESVGPARITFVTSHLGAGGAERHVATLAPALRELGHDVTVVCVESVGHYGPVLKAEGVPLRELGLGQSWKRRPVAAVRTLARMLRDTAPQVVMTNGFSADLLSRQALARTLACALVEWKHNCGHLGHYGTRDRWAERIPGHRVDRYIGVSCSQLRYLADGLRLDPTRTSVIHNSVRPVAAPDVVRAAAGPLRAALDLNGSQPVIACVAAFRPEKDHATLLHAFAQAHRELPAAALLLVGDGPLRGNLERLAAALGIASAIRFAGVRDDVAALLGLVDVVALSSTTIENFPFSVLEAMAMGVPAVCTAVGGMRELVDDGRSGVLVPAGDVDLFAAALVAVGGDRQTCARMGAAARDRLMTRFPFDRMVQQVHNIVQDLVARQGKA